MTADTMIPEPAGIIDGASAGAKFLGIYINRSVQTESVPAGWTWDNTKTFIETVCFLSEVGETRRAIDFIFDTFNDLIRLDRFDACNNILTSIEINSINSTLMVAFLSITLPAKGSLWSRTHFFARVKKKLVSERGEARALRLLNKYE